MKKRNYLLIVLLIAATSCSLIDSEISSDTLKGSTNIPMNTVGNTFTSIGMKANGAWIDSNPSIQITKSENGVNTVKIVADFSKDPKLAAFNKLIPSNLKDAQGRINFETKVKITDQGWLDYSNSEGAPLVAVNYDSKVGDKYTLTKANGGTIVREVTEKSTTDDYSYGFMNIKIIKVEQATSFPGLKKYVARFNHKFGLVGIEIIAEDGSSLSTQFSPTTY